MAVTWTNTSSTDLILPNMTVCPGGLTVLEANEASVKDMEKHPTVKFLMDSGVLKLAKDAKGQPAVSQPVFNGGPVANSANTPGAPTVQVPPAESPGPASNPPVNPLTDEALAAMSDADLKALIKERTGQAVQGNPSRDTLLQRAKAPVAPAA